MPTTTPVRSGLRPQQQDTAADAVVLEFRPNARAIARRFYRHGEPLDDLLQVALEGLLLAHARFDPERGVPFVAYANATMTGTVKRHIRDRGWAVRVPRRVHELAGPVAHATAILEQDLGRAPTEAEIADLLGSGSEAVEEVQTATRARATRSIDVEEEAGRQLSDPLDAVERSVDRDSLRQALRTMPSDHHYVLVRYFEHGATQRQIGAEIGRSQMHVSRVLHRSLADLRLVMA